MNPFWSAFGLILVTEIADKSRIAGLLLATTFRAPWKIFFGMTLGYALLEGIAVAVGGAAPSFISAQWLTRGAGALFIALGIAAIAFSDEVEEHAKKWIGKVESWGPFLVSFAAIAVSEIADRTQITAAALSAQSGRPWPVYAGAMASLTLLNALTVWVGDKIAARFNSRTVHRVAGICFILFGVLILARGR